MNDTPLTDDIARGNHVVPTEFAQDLERQLMEQCRLLAISADREEKLRDALRGLFFFCEEDQQFASPAYRKAYLRAKEALQ